MMAKQHTSMEHKSSEIRQKMLYFMYAAAAVAAKSAC